MLRLALFLPGLALAGNALAGAQIYEPLAAKVRADLQASIADRPAPRHAFTNSESAVDWLAEMSHRLEARIPNFQSRVEFLRTVHFEASHAGLDPQLVLAVIQIESNFRKYAVSGSGARGYMQVMPFWVGLVGRKGDNLFSLRNNLRYGCVILKYYLDREKGNLFRALGRYNGSLGRPEYPNLVIGAWRNAWHYPGKLAFAPASPDEPPGFLRPDIRRETRSQSSPESLARRHADRAPRGSAGRRRCNRRRWQTPAPRRPCASGRL